MSFMRRHSRRLLILLPLALGVLAVAIALNTREGPRRVLPEELVTAVRIVTAPAVDVMPRALGYGSVMPGRVWQAVAEV